MSGKKEKQSSESRSSNRENPESKQLFLKAVLAEYEKLNNDIINAGRNQIYVLSFTIGGIAALLGVFGVIGVLSLLIIPLFLSFCGLGYFGLQYTIVFTAKYIKDEIEQRKLVKLFPYESPIQWETSYQSKHATYNLVFMMGGFFLSTLACGVCLITVPWVFWNEVSSSIIYVLAYSFGWVASVYYIIWGSLIFHTLASFGKNLVRA